MAAKSTQIIYRNNLDADTPDGDTYKVPMKVFDSRRSHTEC